jgi:hypothetical protein
MAMSATYGALSPSDHAVQLRKAVIAATMQVAVARCEHEHLLEACSSALKQAYERCASVARHSNTLRYLEGPQGKIHFLTQFGCFEPSTSAAQEFSNVTEG